MSEFLKKIEKFKYPLLVLILGIILMLLPSRSTEASSANEKDELMQRILSCSDGVGEAQVIISDNGVVVVCRGADNARVRLEIIQAVGTYTGFASDKITVLKMAE